MRQVVSLIETLRRRIQRIPVVRVVVTLILGAVALQAAVITILTLVTKRRARRLPPGGFPHPDLPEVAIGENYLQIYSYGERLYDAMLDAIDHAYGDKEGRLPSHPNTGNLDGREAVAPYDVHKHS